MGGPSESGSVHCECAKVASLSMPRRRERLGLNKQKPDLKLYTMNILGTDRRLTSVASSGMHPPPPSKTLQNVFKWEMDGLPSHEILAGGLGER